MQVLRLRDTEATMGEKTQSKSKGKSAKSTKRGLRPHELREQQDAGKEAATRPIPQPAPGRK